MERLLGLLLVRYRARSAMWGATVGQVATWGGLLRVGA